MNSDRPNILRACRQAAATFSASTLAAVALLTYLPWDGLAGLADADRPSPAPAALPTLPLPSPLPVSFHLVEQPWRLTPDGTWTAVVKAAYVDAQGDEVQELHGDVDFASNASDTLGLVRRIYMGPAALVTLAQSHPVRVTAKSNVPALGTAQLDLDAPADSVLAFAAVAQTVGPHLVNVGWTPLADSAEVIEYKIFRASDPSTRPVLIAMVSPNTHGLHDPGVAASSDYRYTVVAVMRGMSAKASTAAVRTSSEMQTTSLSAISGKGMFLYFAPAPTGDHGWATLDPDAIVGQARNAGIRDIQVRMAYGAFFEADNEGALAWINRLIDGAAAAGIKLLAWEVPRRGTTEDAAQSVAIARYRTPSGNAFDGLALDIENGDDYMGDGEDAKQSMVDYIKMVRDAVGPRYLIVATIISPHLTHWTNKQYPYARIAPYASVMQPMEYWHHFYESSHHNYSRSEVQAAVAGAVAQTRLMAGRDIPVNVAGQSVDIGKTGVPSAQEMTWSLEASRASGAIGEMFFDWSGTAPQGWAAIGEFPW